MRRKIKVSEICVALNLQYVGSDIQINGINLCNRPSIWNRVLTYVVDDSYVDILQLNRNVAGLILRKEDIKAYAELCKERELTLIVCDNPEDTFYNIHSYLYTQTDFYDKHMFSAQIGSGSVIHPKAIIEDGTKIGEHVIIGPNSVIHKGTVIEDNCIIGSNTVIGSEGFQVVQLREGNCRIIHCGGVVLKESVNVGDNVTICNSLFEDTSYIGRNVKIDNLVYVAHNVVIGDNSIITAGVKLCGSSMLGNGTWIGVNSSVLNRVKIGDGAKIGAGSVVTKDIPEYTLAYGVPAKIKKKYKNFEKHI